jgi:hypothetical protein
MKLRALLTGLAMAVAISAASAQEDAGSDSQGFDSYNQAIQQNWDHQSAIQNEFGNVIMGNSTYQNPETGDQVVLPYDYNSDPQTDQNGNTYSMDGSGNWSQTDGSGYTSDLTPAYPSGDGGAGYAGDSGYDAGAAE